jgi:SlyX protein
MTPETLEQIETKIAFLERANAELSDVVYRQQQELDQLRAQVARLADQMEGGGGEGPERPYTLDEEKPPHY